MPATCFGFPEASRTCKVTGGAITWPAGAFEGCCTKASELEPTGRLVRLKIAEPVTALKEAVTPKLPAMPLAVIGVLAWPCALVVTVAVNFPPNAPVLEVGAVKVP
jgi:hypothetical protein